MDISSLLAGLIAFGCSVLLSVVLVFVTFRVNVAVTMRLDEDALLLAGNRSVAIVLGATILCQAILLRHAVFPIMVLVRDLFLMPSNFGGVAWVILYCGLCFLIISVVCVGAVAGASWLFRRLARQIPEHQELLRDNVAVAIFFAMVLLSITLVINEGMYDLSRSLIPYPDSGVLRLTD